MLRESWGGLLPAAIRDLPAAFRRLIVAVRAVASDSAGARDEALNAILAQRNEQLDAALTRNLQLDAAMNHMAQGLAMFDCEHRVIIANARYAEIYGVPAELTKPGTSLGEILACRLANGEFGRAKLEDVHRLFVNRLGNREHWQHATELPNGRCISVSLRHMGNDWLVATHQDVTDLQKAEKTAMEARALAERAASQARVAHTHLLEALDVVPEGIVLFDSDDRYIMWNRRYVEMYDHSTIAVGKSFAEILREGLARGQYPEAAGREDAWLAARLARHATKQNSHEQRLPNGRWVRVEERRTADGGAIGVRTDITELKRREEELDAQKRQFEMALTSITHGLCVFDADERLVMCNEPYLRMYGLSRDRVYPGIKVQDIVRQRTANGIYSGSSPEDYLRERVAVMAAGEPTVNVHHLSDGRIIE